MTDLKGSGEAVQNFVLSVTSFNMTGLAWVSDDLGGVSMEGHTDLDSILTVIRSHSQTLDWTQQCLAG